MDKVTSRKQKALSIYKKTVFYNCGLLFSCDSCSISVGSYLKLTNQLNMMVFPNSAYLFLYLSNFKRLSYKL